MPEDPPPTMGGVDHGGRSLPSTLRTPSEDEGEGGARTRPLPTPGKRARAEEEARAARRQRVEADLPPAKETDASIAAREFGFLPWNTERHLAVRLPLCLFLAHHDRRGATRTGTAWNVLSWVRAWLDGSKYAGVVRLDSEAGGVAQSLAALCKVDQHREYFGLGRPTAGKKKTHLYSVLSDEWADMSRSGETLWPSPWSATKLSSGALVFETDDQGARKKVTVGTPEGATGPGRVESVTFNGIDVMLCGPLRCLKRDVRNKYDLKVVFSIVTCARPCIGVSEQQVIDDRTAREGDADLFRAVVRQAERTLLAGDNRLAEYLRWERRTVRGVLAGAQSVSGVLGSVDGRDVLWSKNCAGVASKNRPPRGKWLPRCGECKLFWSGSVKGRMNTVRRGAARENGARACMPVLDVNAMPI